MTETSQMENVVNVSHHQSARRLSFHGPLTFEPVGRGVMVTEGGDIDVDFGGDRETGLDVILRAEGLVFTGFVAGPSAERSGREARVWGVGEGGQVERTKLRVTVSESEINLSISFFEKEQYFYFLIYTMGGHTFICDPEITNDGDSGDPSDHGG